MTQPAVRVLKILLDWVEKASVLVVASLALSPYSEGFQFFAYFKDSEFPLIMRVSESGPEVGLCEVGACRRLKRMTAKNPRKSLATRLLTGTSCGDILRFPTARPCVKEPLDCFSWRDYEVEKIRLRRYGMTEVKETSLLVEGTKSYPEALGALNEFGRLVVSKIRHVVIEEIDSLSTAMGVGLPEK